MKTKLIILTLIVVVAVSAKTTAGHLAFTEAMELAASSVMTHHYDTLNREVYSKIPPKSKKKVRPVPVMSTPTTDNFSMDDFDDDEYFDDDDSFTDRQTHKRAKTNLTDEEWVADLQTRVDSVATKRTVTVGSGRRKKTVKQNYTLGLCVFDLTSDSILYTHDPDALMKPASTQKLYTAIAFLATRGTGFEFKTTVTTNGKVMDENGLRYLKGDIYVKGTFDPTLSKGQIRQIARAIEDLKIDSIDGRIIADGHRKGSLSIGVSESKTAELNFVTSIGKELKKDSILFSSESPWDVSTVATHGSKEIITLSNPLAPVLQRMLKRSNNDYAESLMNNLCKDDDSWSYDKCRDVVIKLVKSLKAPKRNGEAGKDYSQYYNIIDGSGLSHSNKTSAEAEVMLLRYAYHNSKVFKTLYDNLPIAGVDGTIGKRMKQDETYNNVHAKTGTIDGVSTLAGYVTAANGHMLAFSILCNQTTTSTGHNVQDDICLELAK